ncbi:MAG: hypothetical protein ACKVSF_11110 [Alphaproteobacteria bacterium]
MCAADAALHEGRWHLDKRVPVAIIAALIMQGIGAVWWAAQFEARFEASVRRIERLEAQRISDDGQTQVLVQRLARIEALTETQTRLLERIESRLMTRR